MIGIAMIEDERTRQSAVEGYDDAHDDSHDNGELIAAASAYLMACVEIPTEGIPAEMRPMIEAMKAMIPMMWPFESESFKPSGDNMQNLVKAGAFIAAEIDRLVRAEGWQG